MALRLKTVFFKNAGGRSTAEIASVLASTIWRLSDEVVANLSKWDCDIVTPERGMKILGEMSAFLLHMSDRLAYRSLAEAERARFIQAAGQRLAEIMQDNIRAMVGDDGFDYKANFIDLIDRRAADYASFECTPEKPGYPILRYLGLAVREHMLESDQPWVADQIMDIQAPEALGMLKKTVDGLLSPEKPVRQRATVSGD
ncbi:MAG TPA: hypothetical protein VEF92_03555 [Burkholderiales bacterium]|nr:hypothetical protein [Burkholderiales bacterium]